MFTKRMFALAGAFLTIAGIFVMGHPGDPDDVFEYAGDVGAYVRDIELAYIATERNSTAWSDGQEQLVEGHTTFYTIQRTTTFDEDKGEYNVTALLTCRAVARGETDSWFGLVRLPSTVDEAGVECEGGMRVIVSPSMIHSPSSQVSPPVPTGNRIPFIAPSGETGIMEEFVQTVNVEHADGTTEARDVYVWSTPVLTPWVQADGKVKNIWAPIPKDRLAEMGEDRFTMTPETDAWR